MRVLLPLSALVVAACVAPVPPEVSEPIGPAPGVAVEPATGALLVSVVDARGQAVPEATAVVGLLPLELSREGQGLFEGLEPGWVVVRAEAPERTPTQQWARIDVGETVSVRLALPDARMTELSVDALGAEARLTLDGGVALTLPQETTFTRPDGGPLQGPLTVASSALLRPEDVALAPGGMRALTDQGTRSLESFGMVEVTVRDADGAEVTLDGVATLTIPLSPTADFADGELVGLWHFDEELNYWIQEGLGVVEGGQFVAEVDHFSWWNCDQPLITTCITGTLDAPFGLGDPLATVTTTGVDYMGTWSTSAEVGVPFVALARIDSVVLVSVGNGGPSTTTLEVQTGSQVAGTSGPCQQIGVVMVTDGGSDLDGDGYSPSQGDCDDGDPAVSPESLETCDSVGDVNCDGAIGGLDLDGDGFGPCLDCDDSHPDVYVGAPDLCDEVADNDCDGVIDPREADSDGDGLRWCNGECDDTVQGPGCGADPLDTLPSSDLEPTVSVAAGVSCAASDLGGWVCWGELGEPGAPLPSGVTREGDLLRFSDADHVAPLPTTETWCVTQADGAGRIARCLVAGEWQWPFQTPPPPAGASLDGAGYRSALVTNAGGIEVWPGIEGTTALPAPGSSPVVRVEVAPDVGSHRLWSLTTDGSLRRDLLPSEGWGQAPGGPYRDFAAGDWLQELNGLWYDWVLALDEYGRLWEPLAPGGPVLFPGYSGFRRIEGGGEYACALDGDGFATCWTDRTLNPTTPGVLLPSVAPGGQFSELALARSTHACGRLTDGSVTCWDPATGQAGAGAEYLVPPELAGGAR